jgi:hypothetical protein
MFRELSAHASNVFALMSTVLCSGFFTTVLIYVLTDRRRSHHRIMERMPLGDGNSDHV